MKIIGNFVNNRDVNFILTLKFKKNKVYSKVVDFTFCM
jgi:hypothetical protein